MIKLISITAGNTGVLIKRNVRRFLNRRTLVVTRIDLRIAYYIDPVNSLIRIQNVRAFKSRTNHEDFD